MKFVVLFTLEVLVCAALSVVTWWFFFGWNFYVIIIGTEAHLLLAMVGALWLMHRRERKTARFGRLRTADSAQKEGP